MNERIKTQACEQKPGIIGPTAVDVMLHPELHEHDDYHDGWTAIRARSSADVGTRGRAPIMVTKPDEHNLRRLVQQYRPYIDPGMLTQLEAELNRALVVDETHIPPDVVTMNSRVLYEDLDSGDLASTRLVYRHPVTPDEDHVSVLAPVGAALLGLSVGQAITWSYGKRSDLRLRVAALLYQPEAAGDLIGAQAPPPGARAVRVRRARGASKRAAATQMARAPQSARRGDSWSE